MNSVEASCSLESIVTFRMWTVMCVLPSMPIVLLRCGQDVAS